MDRCTIRDVKGVRWIVRWLSQGYEPPGVMFEEPFKGLAGETRDLLDDWNTGATDSVPSDPGPFKRGAEQSTTR